MDPQIPSTTEFTVMMASKCHQSSSGKIDVGLDNKAASLLSRGSTRSTVVVAIVENTPLQRLAHRARSIFFFKITQENHKVVVEFSSSLLGIYEENVPL